MARKVLVRAELKNSIDRERDFKYLLISFKRKCNESNIMHDYKEHEYFESKSRKARKKKRETTLLSRRNQITEGNNG